MARRWTAEEDAFLIEYHEGPGADFIANHDFDRPWGAGSRRLAHLMKTGADIWYMRSQLAALEFQIRSGVISGERCIRHAKSKMARLRKRILERESP